MSSVIAAAFLFVCALQQSPSNTDAAVQPKQSRPDVFRQLEELLPTPTEVRLASGAPGPQYWQQRADYRIEVALDETNRRVTGKERITYHNHSPHALTYLWVQLDNNIFSNHSDALLSEPAPSFDEMSYSGLRRLLVRRAFDGGVDVTDVADATGAPLPHTIVDTMMRVDLPEPLASGASVQFHIAWSYTMNRSDEVGGRTAAEFFEKDGNWIFELAHWYPRMAAYTDVNGWQHKQFLGSGEFTLEFGDFEVAITVPADHVVASTGELQNPDDVLTAEQQARLAAARTAERPTFVITPEEAVANQAEAASGTRTWLFRAKNVRDFAWATSRKFIWDAWGVPIGDRTVMAMSYWPIEGEPLWSRYSTQAIAHTLEVYSKFTFDYPYPVAISVNGPVGGMEYPMICFNGPRPEEDGTYSARTKYGLIGVIIHEVGHNWFPMIVNSDERQWTWMDEGLNTFVQYLAEQEWEEGYPSRRGEPRDMTAYMKSAEQVPIMTNSESVLQFGANAYGKPATALNVLRETVMGRELFDFAFKEYARRWMFKRPQPADLFRTLEDASAKDLDWFWRGWFYTTDHVDVAITGVEVFTVESPDPNVAKANERADDEARPVTLSQERNAPLEKRTTRFPELVDFYNTFDEFAVTAADQRAFAALLERLDEEDEALLTLSEHFVVVHFENLGGLVCPVALDVELADGTHLERRIPAELWNQNCERVATLVIAPQPIVSVRFDPRDESADVDTSNNVWPREISVRRFQPSEGGGFGGSQGPNPMQREREEAERAAREAEAAASGAAEGAATGAATTGGTPSGN